MLHEKRYHVAVERVFSGSAYVSSNVTTSTLSSITRPG